MSRLVTRRLLVAGVLGLVPVCLAGPAFAADPTVVDRETVQVELSSSGAVKHARLFTQLTAYGNGKVKVEDPTSTKGLRNLDGFGGPSAKDGVATFDLDVDGRAERRTVADFDQDLPVEFSVAYTLDGKPVDAGKAVGKSGTLGVTYHVKNTSTKAQEISYKDGHGKTVTESADVVVPMVGQLTTTLPATFTQIDAPRADVAGDGRGGTQLNWTMVLFEPIGQVDQTFGWSAHITDGQVPAATAQVVPVPPQRKPELKFGQDGFQQGAETGAELTAGATQIDENLGKLQSGAGQLLAGLDQLSTGAQTLKTGLADDAAPGARKLADGAGEAKDGAGQLAAGFRSTDGSPDLVSGSSDLAEGLTLLGDGLDQFASGAGIPAAYAGAVALRAGVDQLLAGIGSASDDTSVLGGLAQLSAGNTQLSAGVGQLKAGADALADPATGLPAAQGGVNQVKGGLDAALATGGSIDQLAGGVTLARSTAGCTADVVCTAALTAVANGISGSSTSLRGQTQAASAGLGAVSAGLGTAIAGIGTGSSPAAASIRGGLTSVAAGLTQSGAGLTKLTAGVEQVKAGISSGSTAKPGLAEGLDSLIEGLTAAVTGVGQLATGAADAESGSKDLAAGIKKASNGVDALSDGLGQIATGADTLADGVQDAADGAGKIADGAQQASDGADQLETGVGKLRTEGTSKLVTSGDDTTKTFGRELALMQALNTRAESDSLPYGAPSGATGTAAYSYELAAATGAGTQNTWRAIVALLLFGAACGAGLLYRRRAA